MIVPKDFNVVPKEKNGALVCNKNSVNGGAGGIRIHMPVKANAFRAVRQSF